MSYNKWTGPLEAKAAELPELAWSTVQNVPLARRTANTRRSMRGFAINPPGVRSPNASPWCGIGRTGRCFGGTPL